ncbi:hypothetical protein BASA81_006862 [Batrachochytrium salamandrivorans]|nr:hypothetical protein BASA81_006862 [Batrachochytrium salamandrivorans]
MAAALDLTWLGEKWPPESEAKAGEPAVVVSGSIVGLTRRVECRRNIQKGFLASKKTLDLNSKYTELTVKLDEGRQYLELKRTCSAFAAQVAPGGEVRHFPRDLVVLVWASATIVAELAVEASVPDPLMVEGDRVKLTLLPGTLCAQRVELVGTAKRQGRMSIMGETHMFGVVQGGAVQVDQKGGMTDKIFAAKAGMKTQDQQPPSSSDVKDEEWD